MSKPPEAPDQTPDQQPPQVASEFVVKGQIRRANGDAFSGALVGAHDKDMRSEQCLGSATADRDGRYEIPYSARQFLRAEKGAADLFVTVENDSGRRIATSSIRFNAGPETVVDVVVDALESPTTSEYERLVGILKPVRQDVQIERLTDDDITFLAGETGEERARISFLAESAKRAHETGGTHALPAEAFYGWFRQGMATGGADLWSRTAGELATALTTAITQNIVPAWVGEQLDRIAGIVNSHKVDRVLKPASEGRPASLGDLFNAFPKRLSPDKERVVAETLRDRGSVGVDALRVTDLDDLVERNALTQREADTIALGAVAYQLTGANTAAARAVLSLPSPGSDQSSLHAVVELAAVSENDWLRVIQQVPGVLPPGSNARDFAGELNERVAQLLPSAFFMHRVTALPQNLAALVDHAVRANSEMTPVKGSDASLPRGTLDAGAELVRLVRRNPGLALGNVIAGKDDTQTKVREMERRVGLLVETAAQNPEKNLLAIDHSPDSTDVAALSMPGFGDIDRQMVLSNLKAYQRAYLVGGSATTALTLLDNGLDAARKIVALPLATFQQVTGLKADVAVAVYAKATEGATAAAVKAMAVLDKAKKSTEPISTQSSPETVEILARIPGYAALFNDLGFCDCEECQSVLGLSAYFVDLMYFVQKYVLTESNFGTTKLPQHVPLHLKTRRADLWALELTCKNATEVVAYLDVVNEVLETYLAKQVATGDDVWEVVARKALCFALPFHWPLERIETYLGHFGKRRLDALVVWGADDTARAKARLGLSAIEYAMILEPVATNLSQPTPAECALLENLYPNTLRVFGNGTLAAPVFAPDMVRAMGASRQQFSDLLASAFVRDGDDLHTRAGRRSNQSIQNDIEIVEGLQAKHLDRLHRFYRFARRLPWSVAELDFVLGRLKTCGVANGLDVAAIQLIARLIGVQERLGITVQELCGLWSGLPNSSFDGQRGLFDSLFNPSQLSSLGTPIGYEENPNVFFLHASFNTTTAGTSDPQGNTQARLLAALQVSDQELVQLLKALARPLGINLTSNAIADRKLRLSIGNLTLLYRHAALARYLKLSIAELFQLLELVGIGHPIAGVDAAYVAGWSMNAGALVDDLSKLLAAQDWVGTASFSVDEIAFIVGKSALHPEKLPNATQVVNGILEQMRTDRGFEFADTVLSAVLKGTVTEEQSRQILGANAGLLEAVVGRPAFRLKATTPDLNAASVTIPQGVPVAASLVATELNKLSVSRLLPGYLARGLTTRLDKIEALLPLAGIQLTTAASREGLTTLVYESSVVKTTLEELVNGLLPYAVLYRDDVYDVATLDFVRQHRDAFGLAAGGTDSISRVRLAERFRRLTATPNPAYATVNASPDAGAVRTVLDVATWTATAPTTEILARALRTDAARIDALRPHILGQLPTLGLDALATLDQCLELMTLLGVSGETLKDLAATTGAAAAEYQSLKRAADGLFAAFRVKYTADAEFQKKVEPFEDKLRSRKRDGLVAYLRFADPTKFGAESDLYHYFLLDIEVEGCARTTRVAAAIFSLQLYVHRVLMHLERSDAFLVSPAAISRPEWAWRKHYRLWQANRKVFLYPENYLEPGLRDDKTPLFEELEATLLQQQISEQNVRDAYAKYLGGFEELALLKIVAACSQTVRLRTGKTTDILHLFGVTNSEPPRYHYRTIQGLQSAGETSDAQFGTWRAIDLNISSKTCSAIVYGGTLFVFWAEILTQPKTAIRNGSSEFGGYTHKVTLKYSSLLLDGRWSTPQRLRISLSGVESAQLVVADPLRSKNVTVNGGQSAPAGSEQLVSITARSALGSLSMPLNKLSFAKGAILPLPPTGISWEFVFEVPGAGGPLWGDGQQHLEPRDDYTLTGTTWDAPYPVERPSGLALAYGSGLEYAVDLYRRTATPYSLDTGDSTSRLALFRDEQGIDKIGMISGHELVPRNPYLRDSSLLRDGIPGTTQNPLLTCSQSDTQLDAVAIDVASNACLVSVGRDTFYLRVDSGKPWTCRVGSTIGLPATLSSKRVGFAEMLFSGGLDRLLPISSQTLLDESPVPFNLASGGSYPGNALSFEGPFGGFYKEILCDISWLIADYLHSQGQFADAQAWYHRIFDPTAPNLPVVSPENRRVWQFIKFRTEPLASLRTALGNKAALEVYRLDPFSPHAIARLRPGAYEKALVMQYIDNLLDWGDSLFAQFTAESINEATMLYVLAADILGPRAPDVGDCGEGKLTPKNYEAIALGLDEAHQFVIEIENTWATPPAGKLNPNLDALLNDAKGILVQRNAVSAMPGTPPSTPVRITGPLGWQNPTGVIWSQGGGALLTDMRLGGRIGEATLGARMPLATGGMAVTAQPEPVGPPEVGPPSLGHGILRFGHQPSLDTQPGLEFEDGFGKPIIPEAPTFTGKPWEILDSSIVFCVPDNKELRAYWNRVDDRLFKVRNCMDISGARRLPELFGPEIDPHLLIRMKAAGLTLDDVMNVTSGNVPPYRFPHLIEKARQYAGTVQSLGGALLSALEKRDAETLTQLRTVHEQHLLKLRTQLQDFEIASAREAAAGLQLQKQAAEYRRDYYTTLSQTGLSGWERTQQVTRHTVTALHETEATIELVGAVLHLIPGIGAPTAMKYGGQELGAAATDLAHVSNALAQGAEAASGSAGLEAGFQRRDDEWKHSAKLAQRESDQLDKQITAADIRVKIAERSLEVHAKSIEQTEEIFAFYQDRFTGLGLYTFLAKTLQELYRDAFNSAYAMAKLAEQAYRFERPEDTSTTIQGWDPAHGGLLTGERLLLDLQNLERKFMESDYRRLEVEQSFSLAQLDPAMLQQLREQGQCDIDIKELFFDLGYPGHYRRRIKAVRLTVPCVAGPFANVGATLKLISSAMRLDPTSESVAVPARHAVSIATSGGQNDAGVFEFSFRDERYMPFEGAGAVSKWQLSLPKSFRAFDYQTISDVVLRISYSALEDETLRTKVENQAALAPLPALLTQLKNHDLQSVISLRHDLPDTFAALTSSQVNTSIPLTIDLRRKASFLGSRAITVKAARWVLRTKPRAMAPTATFKLTRGVTQTAVSAFTGKTSGMVGTNAAGAPEFTLFESPDIVAGVGAWFGDSYTLSLTSAGNVAAAAGTVGIDQREVVDILLHVDYHLT